VHDPEVSFLDLKEVQEAMDDIAVAVWLFLLLCILAATVSALIRHK